MFAIDGSQENLNWSIAGNLDGANPNILSEVDWDKLQTIGYDMGLNLSSGGRLSIFIHFSQRFIVKGTVTDIDYLKDDKRNAVFFAKEDAGKGQMIKISPRLMFHIATVGKAKFSIGTGYCLLNQQLYLINDEINLNSKYTNYWHGPLVTAKVAYKIWDKLQTSVTAI